MSPEELGRRLRALREHRGLKVEVLAKIAGVSAHTIDHWEHGGGSPVVSILQRMCAAMGCTLERFFRGA